MVKKIVWGVLLVGLIGILVAGAIIRTVDKVENVAEAQGLGEGNGHGHGAEAADGEHECKPGGAAQGAPEGDEQQHPGHEPENAQAAEHHGGLFAPPVDHLVEGGGEKVVMARVTVE